MTVPALTTEQMIEVDRLMIDEYGITLIQMMENAGRNLAIVARRLLTSLANRRVLVVCGRGNNGGGGLVSERHLSNWGADVMVWLIGTEVRWRASRRTNGGHCSTYPSLARLRINMMPLLQTNFTW